MKGSPAMQSVPDRLMKWVDGDFMKFNFCFANAKSHTWNKLNPWILENVWLAGLQKRLWGKHKSAMYPYGNKNYPYTCSRLYWEQWTQQVKGSDSHCSALMSLDIQLYVQISASFRHWQTKAVQQRGTKMTGESWSTHCFEGGWRNIFFSMVNRSWIQPSDQLNGPPLDPF